MPGAASSQPREQQQQRPSSRRSSHWQTETRGWQQGWPRIDGFLPRLRSLSVQLQQEEQAGSQHSATGTRPFVHAQAGRKGHVQGAAQEGENCSSRASSSRSASPHRHTLLVMATGSRSNSGSSRRHHIPIQISSSGGIDSRPRRSLINPRSDGSPQRRHSSNSRMTPR
jgi:hypothetical protein